MVYANLSINEYMILRRRAKDFLEEAREAFRNKRYDLACFLAEQAVQLYLKSVLLKLIGDYPRTHYIRVLMAKLMEVVSGDLGDAVKNFIRENRSLISELEDAYTMARYSGKVYNEDDAKELLDIASRIIEFIDKILHG